MLVEIFAGADAEEEAPRQHRAVAAAWAMIAGWMRVVGQVTPVPTRSCRVAWAMPPRTPQTNGACPCLSTRGGSGRR
ncbi:MAG: hypothetical protein U0841_28330 [Chloroflexia bacterium]